MIYENENIPAETIPHTCGCSAKMGPDHCIMRTKILLLSMIWYLGNIGCILAVIRTGEIYQAAICSNYLKHLLRRKYGGLLEIRHSSNLEVVIWQQEQK